MAAATGLLEQLVVRVRGGDRNHVGISGRIEWWRIHSRIACGGDKHDALAAGHFETAADRRIGRTGETHIDDIRAARHRPVDAFEDVEGSAFGACLPWVEGPYRQNPGARRGAQ